MRPLALGHRLSLVLGLTQTLAWATSFYLPAVLIGPVAAATHASPTALVGGFSWALLLSGLASPAVGRRIERSGGRGAIATGSAAMGVGLLVMAVHPGLIGWYLGWSVTGFGMAFGLYDATFATIGRLLGATARPAIVGVTMMAGFASTVGWPLGTLLVGALGWRGALVADAAILIGINPALILTFVPRAMPTAPPPPSSARAGVEVSGLRRVTVLLGLFLSLRAGLSAVVSVQALVLLRGVGLSAGAAVAIAALFGPSQVFGRVVEWGLARWWSPFATALFGGLLLPAGVAALLGGAPAVVFALGYGMSNGILTITRGTLPLHLFGAEGYATRMGKLALPQLLAQAAAPTLLTPLILAWPARDTFAAAGAVALLAWVAFAAAGADARRRIS